MTPDVKDELIRIRRALEEIATAVKRSNCRHPQLTQLIQADGEQYRICAVCGERL